MIHELKILPEYFVKVMTREKTFEIRKNDRDFKVGDWLLLKEWNGKEYTGREVMRYVNYIFYSDTVNGEFGLRLGYCVMNLKISDTKACLNKLITQNNLQLDER